MPTRHAGHYLAHQQADKKLLLVLTDGEPSDVDTQDPRTWWRMPASRCAS